MEETRSNLADLRTQAIPLGPSTPSNLHVDQDRQGPLLHHAGKAASKSCSHCGHLSEGSKHIVWRCPRYAHERASLKGAQSHRPLDMDRGREQRGRSMRRGGDFVFIPIHRICSTLRTGHSVSFLYSSVFHSISVRYHLYLGAEGPDYVTGYAHGPNQFLAGPSWPPYRPRYE